jgi:hypothetical protein
MKMIVTLIAAVLITIGASAAEPYTVYCSLSGASYSQIDYGQESLLRNTLVDEDGRAIYFNSIIGALNYMSERGWRYVGDRRFISQDMWDKSDIDVTTTLIFVKEVTSSEEITEGITTRLMYQECLSGAKE